MRDFPLEQIHPHAAKAAEAAHCAGEQGKYWEMYFRLFASQQTLAADELPGHARAIGADPAKLQRCLDGDIHTARVRRDFEDGVKAGVRGTPTFYLGTLDPGGRVNVTRILRGAHPFAAFKSAIDAALAEQK